MGIEGKTWASAIVEPRHNIRPPFHERPDFGCEAHAFELHSKKRRSFRFLARRILSVDRDEPFEQANKAGEVWLRTNCATHSTFPRVPRERDPPPVRISDPRQTQPI